MQSEETAATISKNESDAKKEETHNCVLMAIGNVMGVIEMVKAMKEVLKA